MDIYPDSANLPLTSQPDLLSRGTQHPKEDDEVRTSLMQIKAAR